MALLKWSLLYLLVFPVTLYAANRPNDVDLLIQIAEEKNLATSSYWWSLLHYKSGPFAGVESQADDPTFFISPRGKTDPKAELIATIKSVFSPATLDNGHGRCRFIARHHWLVEQFGMESMDTSACTQYHEWLKTINPKSISLVFPASYLNSPSSMFGHTLLRIEPDDYRKDIPLASYALNYAAEVNNTDNEFLYTYKGIFGGYPGKIHIIPYHEKIKEYNDLENRDIWEYGLNLNKTEVMRMMRHIWELKDIRFDYFFMSENCSYRLMSLMDVARPGLHLTDPFSIMAIPVDTVRAVFSANLVDTSNYRPSQSKQLLQRYFTLPKSLQQKIKTVAGSDLKADDALESDYSPVDRARIYELAFDYLRYKAKDNLSVRHPNYKKSYELLTKRSQLKVASVWPEVTETPVRVDKSHYSSRMAIGVGRFRDRNILSLKLRPAYHDGLDPLPGFDMGAQINFFDMDIHWLPAQSKFNLHQLKIVNIVSLSAANDLISPISWLVDARIRQQQIDDKKINLAELTGAVGKTYQLMSSQQLSLLLDSQLMAHPQLSSGYGLGLGPQLIYLSHWNKLNGYGNLSWRRYFVGHDVTRRHAALGLTYRLQRNRSLRFSWERTEWDRQAEILLELGLHVYF